jgi:hypothetical protein
MSQSTSSNHNGFHINKVQAQSVWCLKFAGKLQAMNQGPPWTPYLLLHFTLLLKIKADMEQEVPGEDLEKLN